MKKRSIGAALANGMAANALDLDDGYSLLRGHPGAGFLVLLFQQQKIQHVHMEIFWLR